MGTDNLVFLEIIEWFDESGREMVHRIPEEGSGEIKYGAQLIVRQSQAAVFFYNGRACDAFGAGRHTLKTANIPVLTKIASLPWGMTSPLRAEVYFVNGKIFTNMKWGTRDPVAFKDSQLGLIRLRAFGVFNIRIVQPVLFVNTLVGTQGMYRTEDIEDYLNRVIVSRLNDLLGEGLDSIVNLPGRYNEISANLEQQLQADFSRFGIQLSQLFINSITPPSEVQQAIDDKSRLGLFDDLTKLSKMKAAMALEKAATSTGSAGTGAGLGMGFMMPSVMAGAFKSEPDNTPQETAGCPSCRRPVPAGGKFCPYCGHQLLVFNKCCKCGENLDFNARFCSRCGTLVTDQVSPRTCPHCGTQNLSASLYCNHCGEKI